MTDPSGREPVHHHRDPLGLGLSTRSEPTRADGSGGVRRGGQARRRVGTSAALARAAKESSRWIQEAHYFDTNFDTTPHHNPSHTSTPSRSLGRAASEIAASGLGILGFGRPKKWWTGVKVNSRRRDFQSGPGVESPISPGPVPSPLEGRKAYPDLGFCSERQLDVWWQSEPGGDRLLTRLLPRFRVGNHSFSISPTVKACLQASGLHRPNPPPPC